MRAVRVPPEDAERLLSLFKRTDFLDPERRVRTRDGSVEIPVRGDVAGLETVEQGDPEPRDPCRSPKDRMRRRGREPPEGWVRVGSVLLADLDGDREAAELLMESHPGTTAVVDLRSVDGALRRPDARLLAGDSAETTHREYGLRYRLDPTKVMFSPGNQEERKRYADVTEPGERVLDMFSCVGQFSLPAVSTGADVVAVDANPDAVRYLKINAELNDLGGELHPVLGDSRRVAGGAAFDRVLMGHLDAPGHLDEAARLVAPGGTIHYHEACPDDVPERPLGRVEEALGNRGRCAAEAELRRVKGVAPGVGHYVVDCRVEE